jgi:hypothetical protein
MQKYGNAALGPAYGRATTHKYALTILQAPAPSGGDRKGRIYWVSGSVVAPDGNRFAFNADYPKSELFQTWTSTLGFLHLNFRT